MKKVAKFVLSLAAICALTGCNKVSAEKFQAAVDKLEAHEYSEATVKYEINVTGTGVMEGMTEKAKGEIKYTYDSSTKTWSTSSDDNHSLQCRSYIFTIKGRNVSEVQKSDDDDGIKTTTTFYTNPLKIEVKQKGTKKTDKSTRKANDTTTMTFDKYGYTTKYASKMDESYDGSETALGITVSTSYTIKGTETFTISYK